MSCHVVVFKTKGLHLKIENTVKDTSGKRKFKRMLRFLFVDKGELFAMKFCFLHDGSECLALFLTNRRRDVCKET